MGIKELLQQKVDLLAEMKHPAVLELFVLRNGSVFKGAKRPKAIRKRENRMCFKNATQISHEFGYPYYEGFAASSTIGFPIHHAWNLVNGVVLDTTWKDPENAEYMGVHLESEALNRELLKNGYYGVLSSDITHNFDFIFRIDPGLKAECEKIAGRELRFR